MEANVGGVDKMVRIIAGVAIGAAGLYMQKWWGLIGLVPLVTGIVGWCPAYMPMKKSTKS